MPILVPIEDERGMHFVHEKAKLVPLTTAFVSLESGFKKKPETKRKQDCIVIRIAKDRALIFNRSEVETLRADFDEHDKKSLNKAKEKN